MIIDIRQRLVDLGLKVSSLNDPWKNFYRIPGYEHYVVWLMKDCIEVTKDLFIIKWHWGNTISTSVDPYKFYDFFEAEAQIKYIVRRYKELLLEIKMEKIREKLKDLEKDFVDDR
ncbi:MAG: hypothetical protein J6T74_05145 [Clostridia bacterium]|nr:hypothetical protein [Clostridia bacterium]